MKPLVSIMIPVYNRETVVKRALDSAISQTYPNLEIIVCDNASTDNTWKTLEEYSSKDRRIHIFRNSKNIGPVRNWKECLDKASGKYAKFLWSDDEIAPDFVDVMVKALGANEECGFAYSDTDIHLSTKTIHNAYHFGQTGYYDTILFFKATFYEEKPVPVSPGCAMFRTDDLRKALLINIPNQHNYDFSIFGAGNDLLLFLYCCEQYEKFFFANNSLSTFWGGSDSISVTQKDQIHFFYEFSKIYYLRKSRTYRKFYHPYLKYVIDYANFSAQDYEISCFAYYLKIKRILKAKLIGIKK